MSSSPPSDTPPGAAAPDAGCFLGPDVGDRPAGESRYVVQPLPWEITVSWGTGTADGPRAVLEASEYVELWDEELAFRGLDGEPWKAGIHTADAPPGLLDLGTDSHGPDSHDLDFEDRLERGLAVIEGAVLPHYRAHRRVVAVGGEHGITPPLVRAASSVWADLAVVQFDAHSDLRDEYHGTPHSHACAMRRILEAGHSTLAVGLRSITAEDARLIEEKSLPVLWADPLLTPTHELVGRFVAEVEKLPENVYLTFDVDWFDPACVPSTGTPEPGGGDWTTAVRLLWELFSRRTVVAVDVVELAPVRGQPASDFLVAKLIYKMIGYWQSGRGPDPSD